MSVKGILKNPNDKTQDMLVGSSADICFMKDGTPIEDTYGKDDTNQYTRIYSTNHIQLMNDVDVYAPDGASWRSVTANDFKLTDGTTFSGLFRTNDVLIIVQMSSMLIWGNYLSTSFYLPFNKTMNIYDAKAIGSDGNFKDALNIGVSGNYAYVFTSDSNLAGRHIMLYITFS